MRTVALDLVYLLVLTAFPIFLSLSGISLLEEEGMGRPHTGKRQKMIDISEDTTHLPCVFLRVSCVSWVV